jgi:beta-lactam-binding protein with PASTA domain
VKAKRIIFITLNAVSPEKVEMPNVMGLSLRQAEAIIETRGLKLGITSYVPDIAVNYVLRQLYRKREISPNTRINKGSRIDLVVGMGLSNEKAALPNLVGLSIDKARENLTQSILNFGAIVYDNSVETFEDSANAVIWRQKPEFNPGNTINLGSSIDVYLTVDQAKVNKSDSTSTIN